MLRVALCRTSGRRFVSGNYYGMLRYKSSVATAAASSSVDYSDDTSTEIRRLTHLRNVGILAHVDAGKTTVTERMLALAGVVRKAGSVDDGNTVTDYLPAERERGITIQSAAISFEWNWHNNRTGNDYDANDNVTIHLIDTPGHVDFSVEVNRSVAVLDGAVLVVDAVAGVQAQTETVWRAMTRPSLNNHTLISPEDHVHEPLPCLALINKMDKEGCHFENAVESLQHKLPGANPIPIQMPLFRAPNSKGGSKLLDSDIVAISPEDMGMTQGEFVGVVDLLHMRAIVWPDLPVQHGGDVELCAPNVVPLLRSDSHKPMDPECQVTCEALAARAELVEALAEVDESIEEYFLNEQDPSNAELRSALRRATLDHKALPVMAGAALKGKGIEPLLDSIADLLPSPLDRMPPALAELEENAVGSSKPKRKSEDDGTKDILRKATLGHPLHSSLLAFAFKVVHMKGRGGSGDGRVVFARVYSGQIKDRDTLKVISPPVVGELSPEKPRTERVGGMLELAGGRFDNFEGGTCKSGDVCALVGLKSVVTGDTIMLASEPKKKGKKKQSTHKNVCLAGVASPKPVLTVRLEAESSEQQNRLTEALRLMSIEDPSLVVEEKDSATLLSGLGELHIEVTLDRLYREFGLQVTTGAPSVAYRETISSEMATPGGLLEFDRTIGTSRMQAAVHLVLEPIPCTMFQDSPCMLLSDPIVTVGPVARTYLGVAESKSEQDLMLRDEVFKALVLGCQGALKRGPLSSYPMANMRCHVVDVSAEDGVAALEAMPGALRAAAAHAVSTTLAENASNCQILEPTMSVEITLPGDMVGNVLSDLTGRRGTVGDVLMGEESMYSKALVRGDVPLVEILGYANGLRSLTGGEGAFTAEYKGHSPCDDATLVR